jgi:flagellar FliJ protein
MASFRFNLEPVLNYRHRLEEKAKEELAGSLALYEQAKRALERLEEELSANCRPVDCGKVNLEQLLLSERYQRLLEQQLELQTARVAAAEEAVAKCRSKLEKKMQERKVVETLKDKKLAEFRYQQDQEEQKLLDDIATAQFIRNSLER